MVAPTIASRPLESAVWAALHDVHDPARVQPPQANGTPHHRHDLPDLNRRLWRPRLDPAQPKLLPPPQSGCRRPECVLAFTQFDASVIHDKTGRWRRCGR